MSRGIIAVVACLLLAGPAAALIPARGGLRRRLVSPSASRLSMVAADASAFRDQLDTASLLDDALSGRAERGPAIKVPADQKLRVGIIGAGLAGMVTAMDLSEAGHEVEIYEARRFVGGKVSSWIDNDGNHIEMGLHVFFGCYYNLFGIFRRLGIFESSLRLKQHDHTFINKGGNVAMLDFKLGADKILGDNAFGAATNGIYAFLTSGQLGLGDKIANAIALGNPLGSPIVKALFDFDTGMKDVRALDDISFTEWFMRQGGSRGSIERLWDPIAYALGFIDCDNISARCMLTIFQLFACRTEASVLRMCEGSPDTYMHQPIQKYLDERGVKIHLRQRISELVHEKDADGTPTKVTGFVTEDGEKKFDVVVAACDVPGIQKLFSDANENFRKVPEFDNIFKLTAVPVQTVQLRFDGWVTELQDEELMKKVNANQDDGRAPGIDNLLYSADAEFSCFADLALTSPSDYYKPNEGSLMQCVMTPGDKWMPKSQEEIAEACYQQCMELFPSARKLKCTWRNVVKLGQSLYREEPGMDIYRPRQQTPVENFFLAGSYTYQDYIDSMEGATKSGLACADAVLAATPNMAAAKATSGAV